MQCTDDLLSQYSLDHFTYINQIFGDATVREIITEIFPNKNYIFFAKEIEASELFEAGFHHVLVNPKKPKDELYCSVDFGHQDTIKNPNDTLCQTYTLLKYLNHDIDPIMKRKTLKPTQKIMMVHKEMIDMYHHILQNKTFLKEFATIDFKNTKDESGHKVFRKYTKDGKNPPLNMTSAQILVRIQDVLTKWEQYGYRVFIGTGKCPKRPVESLAVALG